MRALRARTIRYCSALLLAWLLMLPAAGQQLEANTLLLVARPQIKSPLFSESVVLVTRHGRSRPMGVILNKPSSARFGPVEKEADTAVQERVMYIGGPVSPQVLIYVFKGDDKDAARRELLSLGEGFFMGMGKDGAGSLLARKSLDELKLFAGLSSWAHGQLENEIARGDWLVLPFDASVVMRGDTTQLWKELLARASQRRI